MNIDFRVLGPMEVCHGGVPIEIGTPKQRTVLAMLLLHANQPVSSHRMVDELWPSGAPRSATANVTTYLSRLRRTLAAAGGSLVRRDSRYVLTAQPELIDLDRFAGSAAQGDAAWSAGDLEAAARSWDHALTMWRGQAFEGLPTGPELEAAQAEWSERRLTVVERRVRARLLLGHSAEVVAELRRYTRAEPLRETGWLLLVVGLWLAGNPAAALEAYEQARAVLAEQLGVEPGGQLRRLHQAILTGHGDAVRSTLDDRTTTVGEPAAAGPERRVPAQLPMDVYGFTGRADELRQLDATLAKAARQPTAVVMTVIAGTAGVGKSALAVHWAHRVARHFPGGQLYVNLRGFDPGGAPVSPSTALASFVNAFAGPGDRALVTVDEQVARFRSLLNGRRVLIVLDNARSAEQVRPLLPGAPGCFVLVTSRNQLPGLVSLDGADPILLDVLSPGESRELLTRRLGTERVMAEPEAVDAIVSASAGLPLALSVVAARAAIHRRLPLPDLAADLRPAAGRLDAFDGGEPATDLRLVMSWSYRTLDEPTARLFRLLSLHPGPDFAVAAAASLAGIAPAHARRHLTELTQAHLLTEHRPGRYTCHDLLRAYAAELVSAQDTETDQHAARSRLLDHYLSTAYAADELIYLQRDRLPIDPPGPGVASVPLADPDQAMSWFTDEHPVLLSALRLAARHGYDHHTCHLAWAITTYLNRRGYWEDWTSSLQAALAATVRLADHRAEAYAHGMLAFANISLNRHADAQHHLKQAYDRYRQLGDLAGQARIELNLGWICDKNNQPEKALGHAQQALRLHQAAGHVTGQAFALNAIGWSHAQLGDHHAAVESCEQALTLFTATCNQLGQAITWGSLGHAHLQLRASSAAVSCYEHAVRLRREIGDRQLEADALGQLGDAHLAADDPASARITWQQALDILESLPGADPSKIQTKLAAHGW